FFRPVPVVSCGRLPHRCAVNSAQTGPSASKAPPLKRGGVFLVFGKESEHWLIWPGMAKSGRSDGGRRQNALAVISLIIILSALYVPFLPTAFRIDDPLFIWAAKNIQTHPANPYGFAVNWYGFNMPMWEVAKNPPLASYYMALAARIFAYSETAIHAV